MNELLEKLLEIQKEIATIKNLVSAKISKYSLFDWLDIWYETYKKSLKSHYQIKNCIDKHIKQNIDDRRINEYMPLDFQRLFNKMTSSRMAEYTFDTLSEALKEALSGGVISINPLQGIKRPKHHRQIGKALTLKQVDNFLKIVCGSEKEKVFKFYLLSGARPEEPYLINWSHVDYKNKTLRIPGTKTLKADRKIPLFKDLEILLKTIPKTGEKIFDYSYEAVYSVMRRLKEKHNLPYTLRSLRHTCATRWYEKGVSMKTIAKWLGHTTTRMAEQVYTELLPDFEKQQANLVNKEK